MTAPADESIRAAARLRAALEQTVDALASPRIEALLACEAAIQAAVTEQPSVDGLTPAERARMRVELDGARRALLQCGRLGAALTGFVRLSLEAQGIGGGYGRSQPAFAGQTLDERI